MSDSREPNILTLSFEGEDCLISRPETYKDLLATAREVFEELEQTPDKSIKLLFVPGWNGEDEREVRFTAGTYNLVHQKAKVRVLAKPQPQTHELTESAAATSFNKRQVPQLGPILTKKVRTEPTSHIDLTDVADEHSLATAIASVPDVQQGLGTPRAGPDDEGSASVTRCLNAGLSQNAPRCSTSAQDSATALIGLGLPARPEKCSVGTVVPSAVPVVASASQGVDESSSGKNGPSQPLAQDVKTPNEHQSDQRLSIELFSTSIDCERLSQPQRRRTQAIQVTTKFKPRVIMKLCTENHEMDYRVSWMDSEYIAISNALQRLHYPNARPRIVTGGKEIYRTSRFMSPPPPPSPKKEAIHVYDARRPGIYLLSKGYEKKVTVTLELDSQWAFSSRYPWAKVVEKDGKEILKWIVSVKPGQTVSMTDFGEEYYGHLTWEARPKTPARMPSSNGANFITGQGLLRPKDSIVVLKRDFLDRWARGVGLVTGYLVKVLQTQLCVPGNIVQDFSRYMAEVALADTPDSAELAVSFFDQEHLDRISSLKIDPQPDYLDRILMRWGVVDTTQSEGPWSAWYRRSCSTEIALQEKKWPGISDVPSSTDSERDHPIRALEWRVERVDESSLMNEINEGDGQE